MNAQDKTTAATPRGDTGDKGEAGDEAKALDPRSSLAEARTDWAEDRTILANERTFAGWLRTGMASLAVAIGLRAVFGPFEPTWVAKLVASVFVLIAILIFWAARRQACVTLNRMNRHQARPLSRRRITLLSVSLSVGAAAVGIVLWLL